MNLYTITIQEESGRKVDKKLAVRYFFRETMGLMIMGAALFVSAGTVAWWAAWAALGIMVAWTVGTALVILYISPELLAERLGPRKGTKSWDITILSILGLSQLTRYIIAGLDQRFGWTGEISFAAQFVAFILCALGYALVVWATAANTFFSQIVRIQSERSHTVVTGGPYRFLRHPGYAGAVVYELAVSVLLTSWWAALISILNVALIVLRTLLEDRTLQAELPGYLNYTQRVRYRLLPGIW